MRSWWSGGCWGVLLLVAVAGLWTGCRRGEELPEIQGAKRVLPFSAVVLFREMPVSSHEFDSPERRFTHPSSPRFDEGRLRSRLDPEAGMILVESPPKMAFKNRGDDCGSSSDRRVCTLPWEDVEITLCGRPFDGHLELLSEKLSDGALFACRVIVPAHQTEDGGWEYAERDCTAALRLPLAAFHPQDLSFRVGEAALVADPGSRYDRKVCERLEAALAGPKGLAPATQEAERP